MSSRTYQVELNLSLCDNEYDNVDTFEMSDSTKRKIENEIFSYLKDVMSDIQSELSDVEITHYINCNYWDSEMIAIWTIHIVSSDKSSYREFNELLRAETFEFHHQEFEVSDEFGEYLIDIEKAEI